MSDYCYVEEYANKKNGGKFGRICETRSTTLFGAYSMKM